MPLLARGVSKQLVKFLAGLHFRFEPFLGSIRFKVREETINGFHRYSERRDRVDNAVVAVLFESIDVDVWRLSEFSHIGQQEDIFFVSFQSLSDNLELLCSVQALGEDHISSSVDVSLGSVDALIES